MPIRRPPPVIVFDSYSLLGALSALRASAPLGGRSGNNAYRTKATIDSVLVEVATGSCSKSASPVPLRRGHALRGRR